MRHNQKNADPDHSLSDPARSQHHTRGLTISLVSNSKSSRSVCNPHAVPERQLVGIMSTTYCKRSYKPPLPLFSLASWLENTSSQILLSSSLSSSVICDSLDLISATPSGLALCRMSPIELHDGLQIAVIMVPFLCHLTAAPGRYKDASNVANW